MKFQLLLMCAALGGLLPAQGVVAIKAGRLITMAGKDLHNAVILIENGKIKSVGTDTAVPWEAKVIDASSQVVMPTFILAHTSAGMSSGNENMANVPYLTVQDAVDPSSSFFAEALRNGVGTVHVIPGNRTLLGGTGMVVKPYGKTVEEMAVRAHTGLKMSLLAKASRMAQIQKMRRALADVQDYLAGYERRKQEFAAEKAAGATKEKEFKEKIDDKKKPVVDLLQGKATAWFYVPSATELHEAVRLVKQYKMKVVLVLGPRCHQAAAQLAAAGLPVVLDTKMEYEETDRDTDETTNHCPAALFSKAKIAYSISIDSGTSGMTRYPWWQMATAMRHGVSRQTALEALTLVPARTLGLDKDLGSIEVGKIANLQILTGDPLQATSWVETVLLDGAIVYERNKDRRLQHLFGKTETKADAKKATNR